MDPEDYAQLSKYKWRVCGRGGRYYAERGVKRGKGKKWGSVRVHREIISVPEGMVCDHINHNGLDNRKANLHVATVAENAWNSRKRKSRSRYKGVWWNKQLKK